MTGEFDLYIEAAEKSSTPKKTIKRPEALKLLSSHYKVNKGIYPDVIKDHREEILTMIMEGMSSEDAFAEVVKAL